MNLSAGKRLLTLVFLSMALLSSTAKAEDVSIGRWCDRMLPGMPESNRGLEIVHREGGAIELRYVFVDGTNDFTGLQQIDDGAYALMGSPFGDLIRINEEGNLEMFDDDGYIRTATRLADEPEAGECQ